MASRARLSAPRERREEWPYHRAHWASLPVSLLGTGARRMEAENYLAGGHGLRVAIEARPAGHVRLGDLAEVWQPSRLKGIQVAREYGTPFLAATQVFDFRPVPRKWLAVEQTSDASGRFVTKGTIMVTCSGSVGRATLATAAHENTFISHDLMRITPKRQEHWGWLYAFLRSPQGRAMMSAAQYGHVIKHLEVDHLEALPLPLPNEGVLALFDVMARAILVKRERAFALAVEAESSYGKLFNYQAAGEGEAAFTVDASELFKGHRRLEGSCHVPAVKRIAEALAGRAKRVVPLGEVTSRIFVPGRFKHIYSDGGIPYLDSADLLEMNPDVQKFVVSLSPAEQEDYRVEPGWLLAPSSGQVYGNLGQTVIATEFHVGKILSNHILRICPNDKIRSGYLQCVLGHPSLGRPQLVRLAFGSSVPEIAVEDVAAIHVPRLDARVETRLADLEEEAARERDAADSLEQSLAAEADELIEKFLEGDANAFTTKTA